jgi:hypothetical protein
MFWIILILIQLVLWWVTFFKTKKLVREKVESRWNSTTWSEFVPTNERYKFPLFGVAIVFLACLVPILGIGAIVCVHCAYESKRDCEWGNTKTSFALIELLKKEI